MESNVVVKSFTEEQMLQLEQLLGGRPKSLIADTADGKMVVMDVEDGAESEPIAEGTADAALADGTIVEVPVGVMVAGSRCCRYIIIVDNGVRRKPCVKRC